MLRLNIIIKCMVYANTSRLRTPPKSTYVFVRLFYDKEIKSIKIRPIDSLVTSALTPVMALDMAF
jgi:hypothetical protein